jgi:hypothetical protein
MFLALNQLLTLWCYLLHMSNETRHVKIAGTEDTAVLVGKVQVATITERGGIVIGASVTHSSGVLISPDELRNIADAADFNLRTYVTRKMKEAA